PRTSRSSACAPPPAPAGPASAPRRSSATPTAAAASSPAIVRPPGRRNGAGTSAVPSPVGARLATAREVDLVQVRLFDVGARPVRHDPPLAHRHDAVEVPERELGLVEAAQQRASALGGD